MTSVAPTRFVQPEVLSRISSLELLARSVVEGFVAGLHRSPYKGLSVDFMEYRPYIPGDDLLHLDWKVYARSDRLYVKEFEDETNTHLELLVDVSGSMGYSSTGLTKLDYSLYIAAALAYLIIRQRDAVGLTLFDNDVVERIPARSTKGHLHTILKTMEATVLGASTAMGKPLHELAERHRRRGFIVLITDLLGDIDTIVEGLKHFRFKGHEVILFHVLDPQEVDFDFNDIIEFEDLETGEKLLIESEAAKSIYQKNFEDFRTRLRKECGLLGIDYTMVTTEQPLDFMLFNYLAARSRKK